MRHIFTSLKLYQSLGLSKLVKSFVRWARCNTTLVGFGFRSSITTYIILNLRTLNYLQRFQCDAAMDFNGCLGNWGFAF